MKAEEVVIERWLARDRGDRECICLYDEKPWEEYCLLYERYRFVGNGEEILLPNSYMPGLTYENSPMKVRITLTPMEE